MSQSSGNNSSNSGNGFDVFDPTGMFKTMRNEQMDAWAKAMTQFVNTDAYADATGKMLDSWLSSSGPYKKLLEGAIQQSLANLCLPSRDEVARLAERLTNIEFRLDDLDAKVDEVLDLLRTSSGKKQKATSAEKQS